jgi:hypothetical protein
MFKPPPAFDFQSPELWRDWKTRFERFRIATELDKKRKIMQVNSLLYAMGPKADKVFAQLRFENQGDDQKYATVLEKLVAYFQPKINVIHERSQFHLREQREGENVESYVRVLHELADSAQFDKPDEAIRDRLVLGIRDKELSKRLQLTQDLTLKTAVDMARQRL